MKALETRCALASRLVLAAAAAAAAAAAVATGVNAAAVVFVRFPPQGSEINRGLIGQTAL